MLLLLQGVGLLVRHALSRLAVGGRTTVSMAIEFSPTMATNFPTGGHLFSPLVATNLPTDRVWVRELGQGLDPLAGGGLREPVAVLAFGDDHVGVME